MKTLISNLFARAAVALPLGLIGFGAASPAKAADFQQYLQGNCSGLICTVNFATVPAGKTLKASKASCYARVNTPHFFTDGNLFAMQLLLVRPNGVAATAETMSALRVGRFSGPNNTETSVYQAHNDVQMTAKAGQRMQGYVQITEGTFQQVACHISGSLI